MKDASFPTLDGGRLALRAHFSRGGVVFLRIAPRDQRVVLLHFLAHEARSLAYILHARPSTPTPFDLANSESFTTKATPAGVTLTARHEHVLSQTTIALDVASQLEDALFRLADHARFSVDRMVIA